MSITIEEARAKLAEKFGDSTRVGGKGVARRKVKIYNIHNINNLLLKYFDYF